MKYFICTSIGILIGLNITSILLEFDSILN